MDERISALIDSDNPQDRKRAIQLLVKEGTQEAISYLSALYRTEKDPEIRDMAVKAGKQIRRKQVEEQWTGGDDAPSIGDIAKKKRDEPEEVPVSDMQRTRASSLVELALDRSVAGDDNAAQRHINKAFQINPNLLNDPYTVGVAADILGVNAEDVRDVIDTGGAGGGKGKRKVGADFDDDAPSWNDTFANVLIYMLVVGAITFVSTLLYFQMFSGTFALMERQLEAELGSNWQQALPQEDVEVFTLMTNMGNTLGITFSAASAISGAISSVIGLLFWFLAVHFVANNLLSGTGTYRGLIYHTINYYTAFTAIYSVAGFVAAYLMTNSIFDPPINVGMTATAEEFDVLLMQNVNNALNTLNLLIIAALVGFIAFLYLTSKGIARNYQFGTATGCITQIIAYVLLVAAVFACTCAFGATASASLAAALG